MSQNENSQQQQLRLLRSKVVPFSGVEQTTDQRVEQPRRQSMEDLIAALPPGLSDALQLMNHKMSSLQQENASLKESVAEHEAYKAQLAKAVESNTEQVTRLGNSVAKLAGKFDEKVVTGVCPDLAFSPADLNRTDVAFVDSALPAEAVYPYTTSELAALLTIHASRLGHLLKIAGVQGDHRYHCAIKIGKTATVQKYKKRAIRALHEAATNNQIPGIKPGEIALIERCAAILA